MITNVCNINSHSSLSHPKTLLYLETSPNKEINRYIQENYSQIVDGLAEKHIDFLYLPHLFQEQEYKQILERNHPYLSGKLEGISVADIYKAIGRKYLLILDETNTISKEGVAAATYSVSFKQLEGSALLLLDALTGKMDRAWELDSMQEIGEQFTAIFNQLQPSPLPPTEAGKICFQSIETPTPKKRWFGLKKETEEEELLGAEVLEKIGLLQEMGALRILGEIIEKLYDTNRTLSPLYITNDYRIYLKDYGMKEVVMAPLPKCLYLLYLRHPDGIRFKKLYKHYDELLSIYRNVTVHNDADTAAESIRAMIDPLNNSVNEKCSRIRAAFLELMPDELAKNYYITGLRGERKVVTLNRSLVEYDKGVKI